MAGEKHANIALFVNHVGCPKQCTFCNQNVIVGETAQGAGPQTCTPDDVRNAILTAEAHGTTGAQLAFFGGSFTGIDRDYMVSLLEAVQPYIGTVVTGIRCSTRPDYIDDEVLDLLKTYHVEAIELGAQSMDDRVLALNKRGHTAVDVRTASRLIKARGFELGLQMMTGLYGDTDDGALRTADELIALAPATVRIYPTVVLEGTELARLWRAGEYTPQNLDDAVPLCAELLSKFDDAGIAVIRLGLHSGGGVEDGCLAGAYHPAFRELCESRIYLARALAALGATPDAPPPSGPASPADTKTANLLVAPSEISKMVGQKRENLKELKRLGYDCQVKADENLHKYEVAVLKD